MAGNPALNLSNYVLNIVELQNTVGSSSGASPFQTLSNTVVQLQEMVQTDTKTIAANRLSAFTPGGSIQVVSPLTLSSTTISGLDTSTIGSATGRLTVGTLTAPLSFTQLSTTTFEMTASGDAVFSGSVTAAAFFTPSDAGLKQDVSLIGDYETILSRVQGVRFHWTESRQPDVGVLAQDLLPVLPEAVIEGIDGLRVSYQKLIPVLVEAVKGLQRRVQELEMRGRL